jgi:DNA mismatch endonuclease (patch repair protein)
MVPPELDKVNRNTRNWCSVCPEGRPLVTPGMGVRPIPPGRPLLQKPQEDPTTAGLSTRLSRVAQEIAQSVASEPAGTAAKPYPFPTSAGVTANMKANRRTDTKPELALRAALHAMGYRYRKDFRLDLPLRRVRPDVAFTRRKVAVFVDGCFWHACPEHGSKPKSNEWYWSPKLARNVERDRAADEALVQAGWTVVRLWEHTPLPDAVALVVDAVGEPKSLR